MISILSKAATWSPEQPFGEAFSRVFSSRLCSAQLIWTAVGRSTRGRGILTVPRRDRYPGEGGVGVVMLLFSLGRVLAVQSGTSATGGARLTPRYPPIRQRACRRTEPASVLVISNHSSSRPRVL